MDLRVSRMRNYNSSDNTRNCKCCGLDKQLEEFKQRIKTLKSGEQVINYREICNNCSVIKLKNSPKPTSEQRKAKYRKNPIKVLINDARGRAKRKGVSFDITEEDLTIPKLCPLLNIPILISSNGLTDNSPSIDRIDNTKGYIKGNVMIISHKANTCKNSLTLEQLQVFATNILGFCINAVKQGISRD